MEVIYLLTFVFNLRSITFPCPTMTFGIPASNECKHLQGTSPKALRQRKSRDNSTGNTATVKTRPMARHFVAAADDVVVWRERCFRGGLY